MKRLLLAMGITGLVIGASYLSIGGVGAVPDDTAKTGQACNVCHTAEMPQLTDVGMAYEAIPTHRTDPAGAWAQLTTATPAETPGETPSGTPTPGALPPTGQGADPGASPSQLPWLAAGLGGVLLASSVALFLASRRRTGPA